MVFNNCVIKSKKVVDAIASDPLSSPKPSLCMNYEFIDDAFLIEAPSKDSKTNFFTYCPVNEEGECIMFKKTYSRNAKVIMDNHPLMIMAKEEQRNLLRHPLCLALIRRKWQNYGRYLYSGSLIFYLIFLAFLTTYALLTPYSNEEGTFICDDTQTTYDVSESKPYLVVCRWGVFIIVIFEILMEIVQFYRVK